MKSEKLLQENMILAAEKQNLHAELAFYKNELAKLCLRHNVQFPVFRPITQKSCSSSTDGGNNTFNLT